VLEPDQLDALKDYLSLHPNAGDLIAGSGGARKLRWAAKGKGKRGGSRVIYFYQHTGYPLVLLMIYAKGDKSDITEVERKMLKILVNEMKEAP
jgi:hypothetical protein